MNPILSAATERWRQNLWSATTLATIQWWLRQAPEDHRNVLALFATLLQIRESAGDVAVVLADWYGKPLPAEGDSPVPDDGLSVPDEKSLRNAMQMPWIGAGKHESVLVIRNGLLLSWRQHQAELAIAQALRQKNVRAERLSLQQAAPSIAKLFAADVPSLPQAWQRVAVATVIHNRHQGRRLTLITGGPGTGKTTTVARLLALFLMHQEVKPERIRIVAPTGKAADRLASSLRNAVAEKSEGNRDDLAACPLNLRREIPTTATTIHKLLGANPASGTLRATAEEPLALELLILDEASMVDPVLLAAVLAALPPQAHLVLIGDPHQLTSIESGSLLPDLCKLCGAGGGYDDETLAALAPLNLPLPKDAKAPALRSLTASLRHNFRAEKSPALVALANAILAGDVSAAMQTAQVKGSTWLLSGNPRQLVERIIAHAGQVQQCPDLESALVKLGSVQVLSAQRQGSWGAQTLCQVVDDSMCPDQSRSSWYQGRAVLITANDPTRGLMNGDVGLCWPVDGELLVHFPRPDGILSFSTADLPSHESAWAITIHKSQGSEYAQVHAVLPTSPDHPLCIRELLYTAVTRASARVAIWSSPEVFATAIQTTGARRSGLIEACG